LKTFVNEEESRCPHCGGNTGYVRETTVIERACYDWDGGRMGDMEPLCKDPSVTFCMDCGGKLNGRIEADAMSRPSIAGGLRECASRLERGGTDCGVIDALKRIADEIDHEHARRMDQQASDLRKAFCKYFGGVVNDYKHGIKRTRKRND
jgi:hypothetical protein